MHSDARRRGLAAHGAGQQQRGLTIAAVLREAVTELAADLPPEDGPRVHRLLENIARQARLHADNGREFRELFHDLLAPTTPAVAQVAA